MKAIDTNILLYARRKESPQHQRALALLRELSEGSATWGLPWPCIAEFLRVITHPRFYDPPSPLDRVLRDLRSLLDSPSLVILGETDRHSEIFLEAVEKFQVRGNLIFDAKIYALCREHGVSEFLTADRDFLQFKELKVTNPFTD